MPIVIQVTPASAAGLQVALQPPVATSETVWKPQGPLLARPAGFLQVPLVEGPAVQPSNMIK